MTPDLVRREAYTALLELEDEPSMEPRTHVLTVQGHPLRQWRYRGLSKRFQVAQQIDRLNERLSQ